jgi:hypothetical protein
MASFVHCYRAAQFFVQIRPMTSSQGFPIVIATLLTVLLAYGAEAATDPGQSVLVAQASTNDTKWTPTSTQVQDIQRRLAELGFNPGSADGKIGPRTLAALQEYQRSINVDVDGQLTEDLYLRLMAPPTPAANSAESPPVAETVKPEGAALPAPSACPPAAGKWLFQDQQGSSFELALGANGQVGGPAYPQHWHWESTDLLIKIVYDNGMGLAVTRNGRLEQEDLIIGDAKDSRGRSWTWTARRLSASETGSTCPPASGP